MGEVQAEGRQELLGDLKRLQGQAPGWLGPGMSKWL